MKRPSAMKNVEKGGKAGARFASFFMAAQADASYSRSECFIGRCEVMRNDKLSVQSMDFAVEILALVKELKAQRETIVANQIGRSGTSIGANIREAQYAQGKADFISKLQIALKEANETGYWLRWRFRFCRSDWQRWSPAVLSVPSPMPKSQLQSPWIVQKVYRFS